MDHLSKERGRAQYTMQLVIKSVTVSRSLSIGRPFLRQRGRNRAPLFACGIQRCRPDAQTVGLLIGMFSRSIGLVNDALQPFDTGALHCHQCK
ncbi:hypothetical protein BGL_1c17630 [Burkholderia plantarii]|uniref:Uncharacterized protein n=1 Tax=Burkholderia plantarii TaxID=41899 RepID=A0A0B6RLS8_BURPL|nr:hypothetical protein BGL_1c17630 [Burkholderia plantarii]